MKKALVGTSLSLGFVCLLASTNVLFQSHPSEGDRSDAWTSFVVGLTSASFGGWLIWDAKQKELEQLEQAQTNHLSEIESIFLDQLQANEGYMSCINFAIAAKISIEESKQYLEQKSTQLNATINIDDKGGNSYHFHL